MLQTFGVMTLLAARGADAAKTASKNCAISKPSCKLSAEVSIRYSSSAQRLYLESADGETRGGRVKLEDIWKALDGGTPLYAVQVGSGDVSSGITGTRLLTESLNVEDGITLQGKHMLLSRYLASSLRLDDGWLVQVPINCTCCLRDEREGVDFVYVCMNRSKASAAMISQTIFFSEAPHSRNSIRTSSES